MSNKHLSLSSSQTGKLETTKHSIAPIEVSSNLKQWRECNIITTEDIKMIADIQKYFNDHITSHSEYQLRHFVINQFITPDRKHYQALRELYPRLRSLLDAQHQYTQKELDIKIAEAKINAMPENSEIEILEKKKMIEEVKYLKATQQFFKRDVAELMREIRILYKLLKEIEPFKKYEVFEDSEEEYWEIRKKLDGKIGVLEGESD